MSAVLQPGRRQVRRMGLADLDGVHAIECEAYQYPWSRRIFADCLGAGYCGLVSEQDEQITGFALSSSAAGESHILNICVAPQHQRQGYAADLLRRLMDFARWDRVERVLLEVRESNLGAIALYKKYGFERVGVRKDYYPAQHGREDAWVMARSLLGPAVRA
jgi:ribosomal-protein-alanine N-acetyltransferase